MSKGAKHTLLGVTMVILMGISNNIFFALIIFSAFVWYMFNDI